MGKEQRDFYGPKEPQHIEAHVRGIENLLNMNGRDPMEVAFDAFRKAGYGKSSGFGAAVDRAILSIPIPELQGIETQDVATAFLRKYEQAYLESLNEPENE